MFAPAARSQHRWASHDLPGPDRSCHWGDVGSRASGDSALWARGRERQALSHLRFKRQPVPLQGQQIVELREVNPAATVLGGENGRGEGSIPYLLRGICMHGLDPKSGANRGFCHVYIFPGVGTSSSCVYECRDCIVAELVASIPCANNRKHIIRNGRAAMASQLQANAPRPAR